MRLYSHESEALACTIGITHEPPLNGRISIIRSLYKLEQQNKEVEESMSANVNKINNKNTSPLLSSQLG
jgi:hypothetical protein